jgi:GPH family glycoside/pentoside/hexuronide:cation symporter
MSVDPDLDDDARAAALRRTPVGLGMIAVYGSGTLADSITNTALNLFLFFYLTAVCGLPNSLAGLSGLVALSVDALGDPLLGALSDNSYSRFGRRHPFMLGGILPLSIGLGLLFSIPTGLSGMGLFAFVVAVSIVLRVSHSAYFLPYVGLGAELSDDYTERTNIVSSRFLFSVLGTAGCVALGQYVFMSGPGGNLHRAAYSPFGWSCAFLVLLGGLGTTFGTFPALKRMHKVVRSGVPLTRRLARDAIELARNPSFRAIFFSLLLMFIAFGVVLSLTLHANTFFWKLPSGITGLILLAAPAGTLLGVLISVVLTRRFEKRAVVIVGLVGICILQGALPLLKVIGLLLPIGNVLYALLIANALGMGTLIALVGIAFQSAMADAADEHEHLFGTRRESLYYAGLNLASKAATGIGGLIAGASLDLIGFPVNIAAKGGANIRIAPKTLQYFGLIFGPGTAAIFVLATAAFLFYRLDRGKTAEIQAALSLRRKAV